MHEMRVHDRRPPPHEPERDGRVEIEAHATASRWARRLRASARRTRARRARPRAARACARPSPRPQQREQREQMRLRPRDAGDLLHVQDLSSSSLEHAVGPVVDRVIALDARAQLATELARPSPGPPHRSPRMRAASAGESSCGNRRRRLDAADERIEARIRDQHRQARPPASKTTLSSAPLAHVVDEHVGPRVAPSAISRSRDRVLDRRARRPAADPRLSAARYARSSSVSDGPRSSSSSARRRAPPASTIVVEALRRRGPPSASSRRTPSDATRAERAATSIPWPIATTFGESSGNERRSTVSTASTRARQPQEPGVAPVGEPEKQRRRAAAARAAPRAPRRSATCARAPRRARERSSGASAATNRAPRTACVAPPIVLTRTFAGRSTGTRDEREHDDLVDALGERPQHRDGRAERRIVGVDALGDDDELHESTSSRIRVAYSSGETSQRSPAARALAASRVSSSWSSSRRQRRCDRLRLGTTEHSVDAVRDEVGDPADVRAEHRTAAQLGLDHDAPHALATATGERAAEAASSAATTSAVESRSAARLRARRRRARDTSVRVPVPTMRSGSATRGLASRHASASPSMFLYGSSTPMNSTVRCVRQRRAGPSERRRGP